MAVVSLALGIGANTAIFSLMDAVLFRTLPVRNPEQLYFLAHEPGPAARTSSNYPLFERYTGAEVFSGVTAYASQSLRVTTPEGIQPVTGQFVSGNYHALLGVPIALGRGFSSEPDRETGRSPIAVISDGYWARAFGRDPDAIGKTLTIRGRPVTIVGVTAPGFYGFEPVRTSTSRCRCRCGPWMTHNSWTTTAHGRGSGRRPSEPARRIAGLAALTRCSSGSWRSPTTGWARAGH